MGYRYSSDCFECEQEARNFIKREQPEYWTIICSPYDGPQGPKPAYWICKSIAPLIRPWEKMIDSNIPGLQDKAEKGGEE